MNPKGVSRCWHTAKAIFSRLGGRLDLMDRTFWSLYISSSPFYKRQLFDGMHIVMSVNDPDDFNRAVLGTRVQNSWRTLCERYKDNLTEFQFLRLQPTAPSGRKVEKHLSVLKMAVFEGLECCVLAFMKLTFLWQLKDNLVASAVGIHEVNLRFRLWMIVRVVSVRAKLPANNPCVTNLFGQYRRLGKQR